MSIICKLIGHKPVVDYKYRSRGYERIKWKCARCHAGDDCNLYCSASLKSWFYDLKWAVIKWFRPCGECGKRFGRHDNRIDHVPF